MSQTLKIKAGDTVEVRSGKDRGKRGRVIETLPKQGRVLVENVNVTKRHRRPRPIQNSSRMGGSSRAASSSSRHRSRSRT
jgi:large subunit ribosomal protein L24